jgi:hypothetical protein
MAVNSFEFEAIPKRVYASVRKSLAQMTRGPTDMFRHRVSSPICNPEAQRILLPRAILQPNNRNRCTFDIPVLTNLVDFTDKARVEHIVFLFWCPEDLFWIGGS